MASVSRDRNGLTRVQFFDQTGKRRSVRMGKCNSRQAEGARLRVEQIITARVTGVLEPEAAEWLRDMDDTMHSRLARVGLVEPRERVKATVGSLLTQVFAGLAVKPGTRTTYEQTRTSLETLLGKDRALVTVKALDAEKWRQALVESGLSVATVSKRVKTARAFFKQAVRWQMIAENPFADVKAGSQRNPDRLVFVARESVEKVLAVCSDPEMRALIALSRYGALRVPSEALLLRWDHVDWENGRITVPSPKTAGQGRESRTIPLFPELKTHLLAAFHAAPDGADYVIRRARDPKVNLRTALSRLLARAGVQAWPRLWHAMRAARATELTANHPAHVAAAWCGHTEQVAMGHYWQVRDVDFDKALAGTEAAVQNPAQNAPECAGTDQQPNDSASEQAPSDRRKGRTQGPEIPALAGVCGTVPPEMQTPRDFSRGVQVTPWGSAQSQDSSGKSQVSQGSGAESGAPGADSTPSTPPTPSASRHPEQPADPDLAAVVSAWGTLPAPIRAAVMAMVRSVGGGA